MSETSFSFVKIAEEELRLAANDLEDLKRRVAGGIIKERDEKDPELGFSLRRIPTHHEKTL